MEIASANLCYRSDTAEAVGVEVVGSRTVIVPIEQTARIDIIDRIVDRIVAGFAVEVDAACLSDRITGEETAQIRLVVALAQQVEPGSGLRGSVS